MYQMPLYASLEDWEARKRYLREHILVCAGLWPLPEKTPLNPRIYHTIVHDDYTVETVVIETFPGFFLGGNVYKPKGKGPFPAVLSPHGHFKYGRLTNDSVTSVPGRCINLARQGYVAFAYDMVGYNDTRQVGHSFADDSISRLYGINLLGLQLWNSIRALDFLSALSGVDQSRIGITGASGGGTQVFLLTAVDNRFQATAPVNMVSDNMQGGDLCENAPGLRTNTFNVEIASMAAPKPLLLVSNTHDWTYNTRNTIFPMVRSVYSLYRAEDKLKNVHFDYPHNYNKAAREAVYSWFGRWLLPHKEAAELKEKPFLPDEDNALLAFMKARTADRVTTFGQLDARKYDHLTDTLGEEGLKSLLKDSYLRQTAHYWPGDAKSLETFRELYGVAIRHLIGASAPGAVDCRIIDRSRGDNFTATRMLISEKDKNHWIPCMLYQPLPAAESTVILTADEGKRHWVEEGKARPRRIVGELLARKCNVLIPDLFKQGEHILQDSTRSGRDETYKYFTAYNLTDRQEQIQDLLTVVGAVADNGSPSAPVALYAAGKTGMTGLLAAAVTDRLDRIVLDGARFNPLSEEEMLTLQVPGIMRIGGIKTVLMLVSDRHLLISGASPSFAGMAEGVSAAGGGRRHFSVVTESLNDQQVLDFILP